ncbi:MAG: serine/threonine protein kinase, partial [Planctomycetes bacterium]|nr:serine/threonine protein kinase [Planctomycetota bacterium]
MSREPFGQIALRNGLISAEQLEKSLHAQKVLHDLGILKKLGEVMRELGVLHQAQVRSILNAQGEDVGPRLIGGFEVLSKIGRGAMGSVFKARQVSMDRIVALKVLSPQLAEDPIVVQRIRHEAMLSGKLNHPNIVQGIEMGEADGYYFFAMEYVEGETLHKIIVREGWLPEPEALRILVQIASALEHAHKFGIVHRDIKPGNIMITDTGVAKLCDLGLARWREPEVQDLKEVGTAVGTPYYISPEQVEGRPDVDIRSDLYSLGATLYRTVVGQVPYDGAAPAIIMDKHLTQELPSPKALNPAVSDGMCRILIKMLAKDRAQRYQTPTEVRRDLESLAQGQPIFWARPHGLKPRWFLAVREPAPSPPSLKAAEARRDNIRKLAQLHAQFVEVYPDAVTRFNRLV